MIKLVENDKKIEAHVPYNEEFNTKIRNLRGKFNYSKKAWVVEQKHKNFLLEILKEVYGYEENGEKITIEYKADDFFNGNIEIKNLTIAKRFYRDKDVVIVHEDSIIVSGNFKSSGGSRAKPSVGESNAVLRSTIFKALYDSLTDEEKEKIKIINIEEKSSEEKIKNILDLINDLSDEELKTLKEKI